MTNIRNLLKSLMAVAILSTASILNPAMAQDKVDVESGKCEDNTCSTRVLKAKQPAASSSSTTGGAGSSCTPGSYANSPTACPTGYTGTMFSMTYVTCPGGPTGAPSTAIGGTNTSGCTLTPPPTPTCTPSFGQDPSVACGAGFTGYKFTTTTVSCPAGPYGAPQTTTSGYDSSNCAAAIPTCISGTQNNAPVACAAGYSGTRYTTTTTSCPTGPYGAPSTSTSGYNTTGCTPIPGPGPVTCTPSSTPNTPVACAAGFSGTRFKTTTVSCPSGPYGAPSTSTSGYDTSGCTALPVTCTPSSTPNAGVACGVNQLGMKYTTTTVSCPSGSYGAPSSSTSGYNTSGCSPAPATCSADSWPNPPVVCGAGYVGNKFTTTTRSCPSGQYGAPAYATSGYDTSGCSFAVPPPPPQPPVPSCTDADNVDPNFYLVPNDNLVEVQPNPSWGAFCGMGDPVNGYVGSMYQCESGKKAQRIIAVDGSCMYNWSMTGTWSGMVAGGAANLKKYVDIYKKMYPKAY